MMFCCVALSPLSLFCCYVLTLCSLFVYAAIHCLVVFTKEAWSRTMASLSRLPRPTDGAQLVLWMASVPQ